MEKDYYTMKDVVRLTKYSLRQLERFLASGELVEVDHRPHHERKVSQASVQAFLDAHGIRPIDDVEVLKEEHQEQKQATGDALLQIATLRARVEDLEHLVKRGFAEIEARFHAQFGRRSRESTSAAPDGAISLVAFARQHKIQRYGKLRGLAEREPTLVTVIVRPNATEKPRKWMITPEQMAPLLNVLEDHGIVWHPCCDQCPHIHNQVPAPYEERDQLQLAQ